MICYKRQTRPAHAVTVRTSNCITSAGKMKSLQKYWRENTMNRVTQATYQPSSRSTSLPGWHSGTELQFVLFETVTSHSIMPVALDRHWIGRPDQATCTGRHTVACLSELCQSSGGAFLHQTCIDPMLQTAQIIAWAMLAAKANTRQ